MMVDNTGYKALDEKRAAVDLATSEGRLALLKSAGLDPGVAGVEVRAIIDKAKSLMSAKKITYFSKDGVVADQRINEDYATQLRASELLRDTIIEVMTPVKHEANLGDVSIQVVCSWVERSSDSAT